MVVFGLGLLAHKMLAVELLTTMQLVYLLHFHTHHYSRPLSTLSYLSLTFANFAHLNNRHSNFQLAHRYDYM